MKWFGTITRTVAISRPRTPARRQESSGPKARHNTGDHPGFGTLLFSILPADKEHQP